MLKSPKANNLFKGFMAQWTHLKRFDSLGLDSKLFLHRTGRNDSFLKTGAR
jgi:hypothetical protein